MNKVRTISTAVLATALLFASEGIAQADDYVCTREEGCDAKKDAPGGRQRVRFYEGDVLSSADGWLVEPEDGWQDLDSSAGPRSARGAEAATLAVGSHSG